MSFPGYPDTFDPGWWRIAVVTPPIFTLTGTLTSGQTGVTVSTAFSSPSNPQPVVGQQVSGTGIAANTTIATVSTSSFTLSQNATATGAQILTIGAEPVTLTEATAWARVEFSDDNSLIGDLITATREIVEGPELRRALMLQSRCIYFMGFPWSGGYYNRLIRSMGPNPWWLPTAQGIIQLPYPPLQSILSIQYTDPDSGSLLTISPSQYISTSNSTPGRVQPIYGAVWPLSRPQIDSVQITYTCGYGALESNIPASVRIAMRSIIAAGYENREGFLQGAALTSNPVADKFLNVEYWGSYP